MKQVSESRAVRFSSDRIESRPSACVWLQNTGNQKLLCCQSCFCVSKCASRLGWISLPSKKGSQFTSKAHEFVLNLVEEASGRPNMKSCWSKSVFSGKGSCLGFPTLTQKFTVAHGSRKTQKSEPLKWKKGWKAEKCYSTKYFGATPSSRISGKRVVACFTGFVKLFVLLAVTMQLFDVFTAECM